MKVIAEMTSSTALVEVDSDEWAQLQGVKYHSSCSVKMKVGNEININELFGIVKQIKDNYIGEEADAIIKGAESIIRLSTKIKELK